MRTQRFDLLILMRTGSRSPMFDLQAGSKINAQAGFVIY